jgi:DNA-damage-inducible protein J
MNEHTKTLHIRVEETLGKQATEVLAQIGMTLPEAVSILLKKIIQEESIPAGLVPFDDPDPDAYDEWFRAMVQEALDEEGPGIPHEQVMQEMRALIESKIAARR